MLNLVYYNSLIFQWLFLRVYVRAALSFQLLPKQRVKAAPLISLPVISEPFSRVAMDIVGPLSCSKTGHRYILVLCDYATRYPEAIALRSIDAEHIAEELMKLKTLFESGSSEGDPHGSRQQFYVTIAGRTVQTVRSQGNSNKSLSPADGWSRREI